MGLRDGGCYHAAGLLPKPKAAAVLSLLLLLCLPACGVKFSEDFDGTELFKSIVLEGDRSPGAQLTLRLGVAQGYPVPVRFMCIYEDEDRLTEDQNRVSFFERAVVVAEEIVPPAEARTPADEGIPRREYVFSFRAPGEGSYFLACFTPAAEDNGISLTFRVRP